MSIAEYIRGHAELSQLDYSTVFYTISTLLAEGFLIADLEAVQTASER